MIAFGIGKRSATTGPNPNADSFSQGPAVDTSSVVVKLKGDPLSTYSGTKPAHGRKIDFSGNAVQSYRAQVKTGRNEFKQWLRSNAPSATVTSEYDISLNGVAVELNGTPLATIAAAPMVERAEYNLLCHPNLSQSYHIINATGAWNAAGGRAGAGAGIKIGDIDSGIDETHPFFDSTGFSYPPGFPKCDARDSFTHQEDENCKYVSPKVIVAKIFFNQARQEGCDAQAIQDHGSHTAGIAAGVTGKTAVVNGVSISDMSGMAPGAWLGNYNVFPCDVVDARSQDILRAVEAAVEDGMDVLNLSLGGPAQRAEENDLLAVGLDNAVDAGVVVAVAAGNSGPGAHTVESPGIASKVITVAASTNQISSDNL
jgi:minor extracellular serine protease Vpr